MRTKTGLTLAVWVLLFGLWGCSSQVDENELRKKCTDTDTEYFCDTADLCCGGACVKVSVDNCGGCGRRCGDGNVCQDNQCVCGDTATPCLGSCCANVCTDTKTDSKNCGSCGQVCVSGEVCFGGFCLQDCPEGNQVCDNKCVDLAHSADHCGDCNTACPKANDAFHIKRGYCLEGSCAIECMTGYFDADKDISNGCEQSVDYVCGNGIVELGESCDGNKLNDQSCSTVVGLGSTGVLSCRADCLGFDSSHCTASTTCGNGVIDGSERCDDMSLGLATCASVVGAGSTGFLLCDSNCAAFDTSYCSPSTTCGNGVIDGSEVCDGKALNNATCASVVGMGSTGNIACSLNCNSFDISGCTAAAVCGNGLLETGEACEGNNFGGKTCEDFVGPGSKGQLVCNRCEISSANCSAASTCGNGKIDGNDKCDGTNLGSATCESVVGVGSKGVLACRENCSGFDISGCTASSLCGNGQIEVGEKCDGSKLNDRSCATEVGFGSTGVLLCNDTCSGFNKSGCSASTTCGNGVLEAGEVCDGTQLKGATCASTVGAGSVGNVLCASDCRSLVLSSCSAASMCDNNKIDAGELCDGLNLAGATCASVVGKGSTGTLKCGSGCKHFDTSGCSKSEYCGDNTIQVGEICDGTNLAGASCASVVGFGSKGVLKCASNCGSFDTTMCTPEVKCGNGKLDVGEACDGNLLNGTTCSSLVGFGSKGTPACNSTCTAITNGTCTAEVKCGNGKLDAGEICDGPLLNNQTCENVVGYGSTGTPACNSTCTGYLKGSCTAAKTCGNGRLDPGEDCDGGILNNKTCATTVGEGSTGSLKCSATCKFDTSACTASKTCGNSAIDPGEQCDTKTFVTNKCNEYAGHLYSSGTLKCASNCTIDTSACVPYCGNGVVNGTVGGHIINEVCDGTNLGGKSCASILGAGATGTLKCNADCKSFDTSGCAAAPKCGDGILNGSEECDGSAYLLGVTTCSEYSNAYSSGKLGCLSNCKVDVSACVLKNTCGDGVVGGTEECDGSKFAQNKGLCSQWDSKYISGAVACNSSCKVSYDACVVDTPVLCGNGVIDGYEFCDGTKFLDNIGCSDWSPGYSGGTLKCTSRCEIDDSMCTLANVCGNGVIDPGEECDGTKFVNRYCKNVEPSIYSSGSLKCTSDCKLDKTACVKYCGNGSLNGVAPALEVCDGTRFGSASCASLVGTGSTGSLVCAADCKSISTANCSSPAFCGDGIINQTSEACDKTAFRESKACTYHNASAYSSGDVKCEADCSLDFSACVPVAVPSCGDGAVNQASEECDGTKYRNDERRCAILDSKYISGNVNCKTSTCKLDYTTCVAKPIELCGNGVLDGDEFCDGSKFISDLCVDLDSTLYASGKLGCSSTCQLTTTACVAHRCGDGILSSTEECDGTKYMAGASSCQEYSSSYGSGNLKCTSACEIDDSSCVLKPGFKFDWCNFQWLDPAAPHTGYGRLLMPAGKTADDMLGYMACTNNINLPVSQWDVVGADLNASCSDCGANKEYKTSEAYAGKSGVNYCTFVFDFDEGSYACLPVTSGAAAPIRITKNVTKLAANQTRQFSNAGCTDGAGRCTGSTFGICIDGEWLDDEVCTGAKPVCNATLGCVAGTACVDNDTRCSGSAFEICVDGTWMSEQCSGSTPLCNSAIGCVAGFDCVDNATRCVDKTFGICVDGLWLDDQVCSGAKPICDPVVGCVATVNCVEDATRCNGSTYQLCMYGNWEDDTVCSGATPVCNPILGCVASTGGYNIIEPMTGWYAANKTGYTTTQSVTYPEGPKITVKGAFYVTGDTVIDGVTNVQRASSSTEIKLENLSSGIGVFSFKYRRWSASEASATISVTDGTSTQTLVVTNAVATPLTNTFTFNNAAARTLTLTMSGTGRVLIDDIRFTSAP